MRLKFPDSAGSMSGVEGPEGRGEQQILEPVVMVSLGLRWWAGL